MKIMKKIISMFGALAIVSTMMSVSAFASNSPKVTTSIEGYTGVVGEKFNIVVEYSGFEDLFLGTDDWSEKGITAMEIHVNLPGAGTGIVGTGRANAVKGTIEYPGNKPSTDETAFANGKLNIVAAWGTSGEYNYDCGKIIVPAKIVTPFDSSFELTLSDLVIETTENDGEGNMIAGGLVTYNDADITKVPGKLTLETEEPKVEIGAIEVGGKMYEQKTFVTKMTFPNTAANQTVKIKLNRTNEEKPYQLPSVVGGKTELIGIIRYKTSDVQPGDTFTMSIGDVTATTPAVQ